MTGTTDKKLVTKYRPTCWEDVIGQNASVSALEGLLGSGKAQAFLLAGPPGTGKTTLARLAASHAKAEPWEIEAAKYNTVDDARSIVDFIRFKPWGKLTGRAVIMDECHRLSKQAWDVLKKPVEEPPEGIYWFFCTTELGKVDNAIRTRCVTLNLKPVDNDPLFDLVSDICKAEKFKTPEGIIDIIVREANGSPRQAIANLALVHNITSKEQARQELKSAGESEGAIELCRWLMRTEGTWSAPMKILEKLKDQNPESVRIVVCHYFAKVAMGAKDEKAALHALSVIDSFSSPFNSTDGLAPLINAVGRIYYP